MQATGGDCAARTRSSPPIATLEEECGTGPVGRRAQLGDGRGSARRPASPASTRASSTSAARRTLFEACRRCFASLFTDRAIVYRIDNGFDHFKVGLSVGVMKMVRSDLRRERRDLHARHRNRLPRRGLHHRRLRPGREHRPGPRRSRRVLRPQADLQAGLPRGAAPLARAASRCGWSMPGPDAQRRHAALSDAATAERERFCITDDEVLRARRLRDRDRGPLLAPRPAIPMPMDIEWAKDGDDGELYIVQARPETVASQRRADAVRDLSRSKAAGRSLRHRPRRRREDRHRHGARDHGRAGPRRVPARRGAGRRHDHSRLGAGDEDGRGHRHQSRRPHLPCRHRRARARRPGGGRRRATRRRALATGDDGHRVLRRGRDRPRLRGRASLRGRRASTLDDLPRPRTADHGQPRQSRSRLPTAHAAQRRRRPGAHGVHHQRAYRRPSDGAGCIPRRSTVGRRPRRDRRADRRLCRSRRITSSSSWPKASARSPPPSIRSR